MNFKQSDRDALRAAQQKINPQFVIGNIIEHRPQDPKTYKVSPPKVDEDSSEYTIEMPKIKYKSVHFNSEVNKSPLTSIDEDQEPNLPPDFKDLQTDMWLNMDQVEFDKLEWMSTKADKIIKEKIKKGTLFDKEGRAIPAEKVNAETDIPEGHDIDGLINLLDSGYDPQIAYALNVVSKIAALATMGFYDGAFSENIHSILLKNCLLRARHQLDNKNETICLTALRCLRSLLCNTRVDEVMLDRIHPIISETPWANFWLQTDEETAKEFDSGLKDIECVEIDAVLALLHRTHIIKRLFYLLEMKIGPLSGTYHECILDILIRIARHSPGVCRLIDKKDNMKQLISLFLPTAITTQNSKIRPLSVKALKFIRLIIAHSQEQGLEQCETETCIIPEEITPVIESYFFIDCYSYQPNESDQLFKLYIETLRMMKVMCKSSKFKGSIVSIMSMDRNRLITNFRVISSLNPTKALDSKISMDWQFAAHLIDLTGMFIKLERFFHKTNAGRHTLWSNYVGPIFLKWLAAIVNDRHIPHIDVSIAIATAAQHYRNQVDDENLENMLDIMINSITTKRTDGTNSSKDFFRILVKESCAQSQFRNFFKENGKLRDPKELPSFGCLSFNTTTEHKLNPLFDKNNPHILLSMFINQFQDTKSRTSKTLGLFIDHIELTRYIKNTSSYLDLPLTYESMVQQSPFAQYEVEIIARSLILLGRYYAGDIQDFADGTEMDSSNSTKYTSSYDFKLKKKECYSSLCHYAVTIIGLLRSEPGAPLDMALDLRDQLFTLILFDRTFQSFVGEEHFRMERQSTLQDIAHRWDYHSGCRKDQSVEYWILKMIYNNLKQFNRFWILRPITDYYKAQLEDTDWYKKQEIGKWFEKTLGVMVGLDVEVIAAILEFNHNMMIFSPSYCRLVIKPNIEDQLTSIATIFLNDNLFLEKAISDLLSKNIRLILKKCAVRTHLDKPEAPFKDGKRILRSLNIPLVDFFEKLVEQFESVSYGDPGFSNFILLFITNQSDKTFRKKLFQEKLETCLGQLRVQSDNVWISREFFYTEKEKDPEIRALIARSRSCIPGDCFLEKYCKYHCS